MDDERAKDTENTSRIGQDGDLNAEYWRQRQIGFLAARVLKRCEKGGAPDGCGRGNRQELLIGMWEEDHANKVGK